MPKGSTRIALIGALLLSLTMGWPFLSEAGIFWTETFENGLYPNWIDGSGCITASTPQSSCYPKITSGAFHSGSKSLFIRYQPYMTQAGTYEDRSHPNSTEVWTRFYLQHQNFVFPNPSVGQYSKLFYNKANAGSWIIWGFDESNGNLDVAINTDNPINCQSFGSIAGTTSDRTCVWGPNISSAPLTNGPWWCVETHVKANSGNGATNGVLEVYVNGGLKLQRTNIPLYTGNVTPYDTITIYAQTGQGDRYLDDFAVGSTRIGCSGTPSVTGNTTPTAPAPPTGVIID